MESCSATLLREMGLPSGERKGNLIHTLRTINSQSLAWLVRFQRNLSARLGCLMTYAGVQLCIRTMDFIINCPPSYVICTMYSIPFFPYFAQLNCTKKPNLYLNISKSTYHIYFIFWRIIIQMTSFNFVQKYENRIFHFIDTLRHLQLSTLAVSSENVLHRNVTYVKPYES